MIIPLMFVLCSSLPHVGLSTEGRLQVTLANTIVTYCITGYLYDRFIRVICAVFHRKHKLLPRSLHPFTMNNFTINVHVASVPLKCTCSYVLLAHM